MNKSRMFPDFALQDISTTDIHLSLLRDGCCMLRNALNIQSVNSMAKKIEAISQKKSLDVQQGTLTNVFDRYHITNREFVDHYPNESLYHLLEDTKLKNILSALFGENQFHEHPDTYCRGIDTRIEKQRDLTSFRPLAFHVDTIYHRPQDKFAINFWIPLSDCGIHRPGIQIVPMSHSAVRRITGFEKDSAFSYPEETIDESRWSTHSVWKKIQEQAGDVAIWRPHFNLGDIMIMTSWVPHASYTTDKMTLPRRSVELRYHGNHLDPLPVTIHSMDDCNSMFHSHVHFNQINDPTRYIKVSDFVNEENGKMKQRFAWIKNMMASAIKST